MTPSSKPCICNAGPDGIMEFIKTAGVPAFRAKQIADWVYSKRVFDPMQMKNLPLSLREQLQDYFNSRILEVVDQISASDGTEKLLLELADHEKIEAVVIPSFERRTFCLSTQVGCPVQCAFCASGADGLVRNLSAAEIIEQFNVCCERIGRLPDNVVFMGIGEGLLNFDNLVRALDVITGENMFNMAARRITVSTSGWTPGIIRLAELGRQWNLAVSLHAPDDETRAKLIPDKLRRPLAEILDACDLYRQKTSRMVTFEYTLLSGINDSPAHAEKMAQIAREHHAKVNLIPYNQVTTNFQRPTDRAIKDFENILLRHHVQVTVRVEKGAKVSAACGQLRKNAAKK
ncbi:MAG: 23S rRNA (adenine(2503)-C(2))-methyltransferase RlmN [Victivallales bacterium]|nr:23S rRNA (adenine(2503)-C(2))-methyltransferase RlmN [Victivallales bacterium]